MVDTDHRFHGRSRARYVIAVRIVGRVCEPAAQRQEWDDNSQQAANKPVTSFSGSASWSGSAGALASYAPGDFVAG